MSQCQGVNIYASGDYLLDERQGYLCTTIERLRVHMATLKERLEEEKMMLSELKAETQYLTRQQIDTRGSEDYHHSSYQSERSDSRISLAPPYNITNDGGIAKAKKSVDESKQQFDRVEYVQRLREIDSLCKEEMARMNSVVEQMEPLKQIASDWMLETRLKEVGGAPPPEANGAVLELGAAQAYQPVSPIDIAAYDHPSYTGELIVVPPKRPSKPTPIFVPEGRYDDQPDPSTLIQSPLKPSKSKTELKLKKEPQLELDSLLKQSLQNSTPSVTDRKRSTTKGKRERKPKNSSSEVSLSSLEALKEKNITLIEVEDDNGRKTKVDKLEKRAEKDWKSAGSGKTSKSAISLESIQRAFANHHRKRRKALKNDNTDALSFLHTGDKGKENMPSDKNKSEEEQMKQDKLFAYLHPSAKKIVKNWVMVGKEKKKMNSPSKRKPERAKRCILNLGRNKDAELSLCEDDVINKFLYDEEGYEYTPLFISETDDECSSDCNSVNEK